MIYLPDFECEWVLSRWTGRVQGLTIDPIGVEAFVPPAKPRGLFGRLRHDAPAPTPYLHVLVHSDITSDRIREWAVGQVAQLGVLAAQPDATGDTLNRLSAEAREQLVDREWVPAEVTVDRAARSASMFSVNPTLWAAYVELGDDRIALVGRDLTLADAPLRTANSDEARRVRTDALRV